MNVTTSSNTEFNAAYKAVCDCIATVAANKAAIADVKESAKTSNHAKAEQVRETLRAWLLASDLPPLNAASAVLTAVCGNLADAVADSKVLAKKKQDAGVSVCKAFESITKTAVKAVCTDKKAHTYWLEVKAETEESPADIARKLIKQWDKAGIDPSEVASAIYDLLALENEKQAAILAVNNSIQIFA